MSGLAEVRIVVPKYRPKNVAVEAIQYTDVKSLEMIELWSNGVVHHTDDDGIVIETADGRNHVDDGDFVVKGITGLFFAVKAADFPKLYELLVQAG